MRVVKKTRTRTRKKMRKVGDYVLILILTLLY